MMRVRELTIYLYRHHFVRYLFVGGTTFVIDFGILYTLHGLLKFNLAASTSVAYWISISYNFVLNRYWTFDAREKESLKRHVTIYFVLLVFNYLFTVTVVSLLSTHINYVIAKALAVATSMTWTYYIYKNYIFIKREA
ncbi:MAG TPA: GtrA family protein [Verrucomicrobiae bacterium]|nr:GtrA family protein [Verrucomicrobiae bacterium]